MTYLILNAVFLAAAFVVLVVALRSRAPRLHRGALVVTAAVLLTLTAVFDNIMIGVGLVAYGDAQISGLRLGIMPVEDFAYTVFAVLVLPALWTLLGRRSGTRRGALREDSPGPGARPDVQQEHRPGVDHSKEAARHDD